MVKKMTVRGLMLDCNFDRDLARCILALSKAEITTEVERAFDALRDADEKDGGEVRSLLVKAMNYFDTYAIPIVSIRLKLINILGEFHGLEYLGETASGTEVEFFNAGDIYVPTIFFINGEFYIDSYGDYLQSHPKFNLFEGYDRGY